LDRIADDVDFGFLPGDAGVEAMPFEPDECPQGEADVVALDLELTETINPATGKTSAEVDKVKFVDPTAVKKVLARWRGQIAARAAADRAEAITGTLTVVTENSQGGLILDSGRTPESQTLRCPHPAPVAVCGVLFPDGKGGNRDRAANRRLARQENPVRRW